MTSRGTEVHPEEYDESSGNYAFESHLKECVEKRSLKELSI